MKKIDCNDIQKIIKKYQPLVDTAISIYKSSKTREGVYGYLIAYNILKDLKRLCGDGYEKAKTR